MAGNNLFEILKKEKQIGTINNFARSANILFCLV